MADWNREAVLEALKEVQDPDLHRDLVSLGMIDELEISEGGVSFAIVLTTPACPLKAVMERDARAALLRRFPTLSEIHIRFTAKPGAMRAFQSSLRCRSKTSWQFRAARVGSAKAASASIWRWLFVKPGQQWAFSMPIFTGRISTSCSAPTPSRAQPKRERTTARFWPRLRPTAFTR